MMTNVKRSRSEGYVGRLQVRVEMNLAGPHVSE